MPETGERSDGRKKVSLLSLRDMPKEFKVALLKELGYGTDGTYVLTSDGKVLKDKYSGVSISIESMVILPGNSPPVILDDSPLSLTLYTDEYGEIF